MRVGEYAKFAFAIFTPSGSHTQVCCPGPTCPLPSTLREVCSHRATEPALAGGRRAVRL